ncbi:MAG: cyclase family protein [Candidatus Omnitrophota bacterium]
MKIIDLTHTLCSGMPVFPGDEPPVISRVSTIEQNGYTSHRLTLSTHTGTHLDAPAHMLPHGAVLNRLPIDYFIGKGAVIDLTGLNASEIRLSDLKPHEDLFKRSDYILFRTGWDRFWGIDRYFRDFPVLSLEAAIWIHSFQLKGIGLDTISADEATSTTVPIHKTLLERSVIIENLTNLGELPSTGFLFSCFPLKLENGEASPIRATALILDA